MDVYGTITKQLGYGIYLELCLGFLNKKLAHLDEICEKGCEKGSTLPTPIPPGRDMGT